MKDNVTTAEPAQKSPFGNIQPAGFPGLPAGWTSEWETFPSADQSVQLFQAVHHRENWSGNRALLVVHGLCEHGGRYQHLPHFLQNSVDAIYCIDQRGHGRSEGVRGHCDRFSQFTDDLALTISRIQQQLSTRWQKPELYVLGHSFGGLVSLRTFFLNATLPVRALITTSPLLGIKVKVPAMKRWAGHALSGIWGSLQMSNEIDPAHLSHDPAVAAAYMKDRLVHDKVTPRLFTQMLDAMDDVTRRDAGLAYPLAMLISLQDEVVDPEVSQKFFRGLKIRDKQLKTYPGFFHEPMNELGKEKVFEDIAAWIKTHSQNP